MLNKDEFEPIGATNRERFESIADHVAMKASIFETFIHDVTAANLKNLNASEQVAVTLAGFYAQICNGGIVQYIDNGLAGEKVSERMDAATVISRLASHFADVDPDLAKSVKEMAKAAHKHLGIEQYSDREFERTERELNALADEFHKFPEDRVFAFFMAVVDGIDPECSPFLSSIRKREEATTLTP